MVRILALLLLVCALVVPRAVWAAHLSGHDALPATGATHSHHGDHSHGPDDDQPAADEARENGKGEQGGPTHDHGPSFALFGALVPPPAAALPTLCIVSVPCVGFERGGASLAGPDSLLRPPRAV